MTTYNHTNWGNIISAKIIHKKIYSLLSVNKFVTKRVIDKRRCQEQMSFMNRILDEWWLYQIKSNKVTIFCLGYSTNNCVFIAIYVHPKHYIAGGIKTIACCYNLLTDAHMQSDCIHGSLRPLWGAAPLPHTESKWVVKERRPSPSPQSPSHPERLTGWLTARSLHWPN